MPRRTDELGSEYYARLWKEEPQAMLITHSILLAIFVVAALVQRNP